ncbi:GNAT family N-acetyltransferase (plasmid) [Synechocystis sp. PCC 7339]|uniref:GNAT family N-acetyltransferase n=1 Tax=unclassified Synechocystis TaxID=2640012 RepID=UPI001BAF7578|nr:MULTISPECIES: GNAT family protein [unclassified Synechocystis]QUS62596.1 GNAT family N-acetyltransferase [Synechocystis sp. PCC 7338]UAJ74589.1 GNAT family N-acetyltransferase [Synechocystis sp. PCC 7339]
MFLESFLPQITERLILRRFIDPDLDLFLCYRRDPQVARFQSWSIPSYDEARSFISEMHTAEIGIPGEWFQIAIAHKQSNLLIGDIGIKVYTGNLTTVEVGFTLNQQWQSKGYAREAVSTLINSLFKLGNINKIVAITDSQNESSIRLLKRLGMRLSNSVEVEFKGEWCVEQTFELNQKDWLLSSIKSDEK